MFETFDKTSKTSPEAIRLCRARIHPAAGIVLLKLCILSDRNNIVQGKPTDLAKEINVTLWEFNKGVRELKELDIVRKYTKTEYMISPNYKYNGDERRFYILQNMWENQTTKGKRS